MVDKKYRALFEPFMIGKLEIKNRFVMAPMVTLQTWTADKAFTYDTMEYFVRRARGGTGLIITGAHIVYPDLEFVPSKALTLMTKPARYIAVAGEMNERIHSFGSKIFVQLAAGMGRSAHPAMVKDFIAPSEIFNRWDPNIKHRALNTEEVEKIVEGFGKAALIAKRAGYDGVEVHAMHEGYLLDSFTMALFNQRNDKYGGGLRGRLTFPIEIVNSIKSVCGKDFPVTLRFGIKSFIKALCRGGLPGETFEELGRDVDEAIKAAKILEEAGYDGLNADAGSYDSWYWAHPPMYFEKGMYLHLSEKLKPHVNVPVIVAGRMDDPDKAVDALKKGKLDAVCLGRPLLADPDYVNKLRADKFSDVRQCLSCHDGCLSRGYQGLRGSCTVNPEAARELITGILPAFQEKKIVVIGGGVAGMEAARVCALRGHQVTLIEAGDRLGGLVNAGGAPKFKEDDRKLIKWYANQLDKLGVSVLLNSTATKDFVLLKNPDVVFVATGSEHIIPTVPGIEKDSVATACEILLGNKSAGDRNVIIGAGLVGCEVALHLAQTGRKAIIVEQLDDILKAGVSAAIPNEMMLRDLLKYHKVEIKTSSCLHEVRISEIAVDHNGAIDAINADRVILACGFKSRNALFGELRLEVDEIYNIGDSRLVRNIRGAIWDGYEVARSI